MTTAAAGAPGDRVVVRFAKGDGAPGDWRRDPTATRSDVTGVLVSADDDTVVVDRGGETVTVPRELVLTIRVLPDRAVRASEIRAVETAAANGWPGLHRDEVDGWLLRAGGGYSHRANSAVPLRFGTRADESTLSVIRRWYDDHELPSTIAVVDRLLAAGTVPDGVDVLHSVVMTRENRLPPVPSSTVPVDISSTPSDAWLATVIGNRDGVVDTVAAAAVLRAVVDGALLFADVVVDGVVLATGRGAVTTSSPGASPWLGISCLWTHPDHRGASLGTAIVHALIIEAHDMGCERAYLQVEEDNVGAIRLYRRLGFGRHHGYRYRAI